VDDVIAAFERVSGKPVYDDCPQAWDEVLRILNLRLIYQLAVAKVLAEGRWRNAQNPRAYVARAAAIQGYRMQLPDFTDREFRRKTSSTIDTSDIRISCHEDDEASHDPIENASANGVYRRTSSGAMTFINGDDDYPDDYQIPEWLQRDDDHTAVDWAKVAKCVARKPHMIPMLARALELRAQGVSRPRAVDIARNKREACAIEAAWRWLDREFQRLIVPLFRLQEPPEPNGGRTPLANRPKATTQCSTKFLRPWEALTDLRLRHQEQSKLFCSLDRGQGVPNPPKKPNHLDALMREIGPNISLTWDGHALYIERADRKDLVLGIRSDILCEALDVLCDPSVQREARVSFGPPYGE
jgi:hypothetical protein